MLAGTTIGMTADEVADNIINSAIEANFPALLEAEKQIIELEKSLAEQLKISRQDDTPVIA